MNTFYEHHQNSIKFGYRCFDRILLNGLIQPFQQPERVIGFFNAYRERRAGYSQPSTRYRPAISELGQEPLPEMGRRLFWMHRREGAMTLSIPTLSRPRPMR